MIVMNKANEGLHIKGIDGIVWFRALDENSKILYLQQLGRAIYSEDPNNPTPDEKRPVIIDLANNTLNVNIDKDIKNNTEQDMPIFLVGNKSDLEEDRKVTKEEGEKYKLDQHLQTEQNKDMQQHFIEFKMNT